jgi:hypothetical protein
MRFLLAGILALLPLNTQATSSVCMNIAKPGSCAETDLFNAELHVAPYGLADDLRLSDNPYSPASLTNFETLIGPYLYVQGREGIVLYDPLSSPTADVRNGELNRMGPLDNRKATGHSSTPSFSQIPTAPADWFRDTHSHSGGRDRGKSF